MHVLDHEVLICEWSLSTFAPTFAVVFMLLFAGSMSDLEAERPLCVWVDKHAAAPWNIGEVDIRARTNGLLSFWHIYCRAIEIEIVVVLVGEKLKNDKFQVMDPSQISLFYTTLKVSHRLSYCLFQYHSFPVAGAWSAAPIMGNVDEKRLC